MFLKFFVPLRTLLKKTTIWQGNFLILREFKHFPKIIALALVFTCLAAVFEGAGVGVLLSFLQSLTSPNAKPIQTGITWFDISVLGINTSATSRLYRISALVLLTTFLRSCFTYLASVNVSLAEINLLDRLRKRIFEQLQSLRISYFSDTRSGEIINTITTELERVKQIFSGFAFLFTKLLTVAVYFVSMLLLSWQLTAAALLLFTPLVIGLSRLNKRIRETSSGVTSANEDFTSRAIEIISGIRTVQAYATQNFERKRFYDASSNIVIANTKSTFAWAPVKPIAEVLATGILVGMIAAAFTFSVSQGSMQVAALLTFFFVLFRLIPALQEFINGRALMSTIFGSIDSVKELLREDNKPYLRNGKTEFFGLKQAIDFISVDFGYDASALVLHDATLTIEKGKMTALVGASGAGKTTLVDLIPRFYDRTEGQILMDGVDIQKFDINSLRRKMAIVSQDTFIFNASAWDNIAYGTEGAREEEIMEAAQLANALEFIQEMPDGFNTKLGDRGVRLSGGQRQRISIARALMRNPEILILDEATSALDSVSEQLIQESLEKLALGRTVIVIAHRLSTIAKADKVVVLEQGRIVEQGSYKELLGQRGALWKYHRIQQQSDTMSTTEIS
jgi:ATP-binding cassette, subfamily B, bacterial MsbA